MKKITSTLSGLTSSLFLNAGLVQFAEKFDPVSSRPSVPCAEAQGPSACYPSAFTPRPRR